MKSALKYPGTRWLMGRSELKTLKKTTLNTFFEVAAMQGIKADTHFRYNQQDSIITLANGSQIILADLFAYPSDPNFDSLGSLEITGAFIDECNQLVEKAKNIVKSRIRFKLNEYGLIPKLLMTCNPAKNWVYNEFYKPWRDNSLDDDKQFIPALVTDNQNINAEYIRSLQSLDKNSRERLLNGNWEYDEDPAALIEFDKIIDCFTNEFVPSGDSFITCDVARFGSDKTVIGLWQGFRVRLYSYSGLSVSQTAGKIRELQGRYSVPNSRTIADEDGVGGGVVDILGCKGFVNNSRPLPNPVTRQDENYSNLKSQCYFRLAERINASGLYIDCEDITTRQTIIQELEQVKQHKMDSDGKKAVVPKEKIKEVLGRSPDFADTLMMREWFELKPAVNWEPW